MSQTVHAALTVSNDLGLHARAATRLVELASRFTADLYLIRDGREVSGKSIMGVLLLAAAKGTQIEIRAEGEDAAELVSAVVALFERRFGEVR